MILRQRFIIRYLLVIIILLIIYSIIKSLQNGSNSGQIVIDQSIINEILKKHSKFKMDSAENLKVKSEEIIQVPHHEDNDHPEEERQKAEEQNQNPTGIIQVNQPHKVDDWDNAPGFLICLLLSTY